MPHKMCRGLHKGRAAGWGATAYAGRESLTATMTANHDIEFDPNTYDIEDSEDVINLARSIVNGHYPGILGTIDLDGRPQMRWMSTLAFDEFPVFQTLTTPDSRKVREILAHPDVNWMFFNKDLSLVVNLRGRARVLNDGPTLKRIWQRIVDMSHAYFLEHYHKKPGFCAIETVVETIEVHSPKHNVHFTLKPYELA
jgi:general stress protein 26